MNQVAYKQTTLTIPIFYFKNQKGSYLTLLAYRDDFIEYDDYGEPIYSGAYFRKWPEQIEIFKVTRDNVPYEIWEGELNISKNLPIQITTTGPLKKLFIDNKFVGE